MKIKNYIYWCNGRRVERASYDKRYGLWPIESERIHHTDGEEIPLSLDSCNLDTLAVYRRIPPQSDEIKHFNNRRDYLRRKRGNIQRG